MQRSIGWNIVRWSEFVVLLGSLIVSALDAVIGLGLPLSPAWASVLAIVSKTIRALVSATGQPSATKSWQSWATALILALAAVIAGLQGPIPQAPVATPDKDAISAPASIEVVEPPSQGTPDVEPVQTTPPDAQAAPVSVLSRVGSGALVVLGAILSPVGCGHSFTASKTVDIEYHAAPPSTFTVKADGDEVCKVNIPATVAPDIRVTCAPGSAPAFDGQGHPYCKAVTP